MNVKWVGISFIVLLNLLTIAMAAPAQKLVFAVDIIRHGDRTPINTLSKSPAVWKQGLGELTAEGMRQEFQLGTHFRKEYIEHYHLLPAHYENNTMLVRSTDFNRTLMSAQSLLLGLYPLGTGPDLSHTNQSALPQAFQPIPIHTIPKDDDILLLADTSKGQLALLEKKYVTNTKTWQEQNNALQTKLKEWSEITGWPMKDLSDVVPLGDNLYICQLHHIALPQGMSDATAKQIIALARDIFAERFKPSEIGHQTSHELLATITDYFQQATENKTSLKYVLYSAHDTTLLAAMSALEAPLEEPPHYASNLKFELFEDSTKNYFVKIRFNDKPVTVPACGSDTCSLSQFAAFVKKMAS